MRVQGVARDSTSAKSKQKPVPCKEKEEQNWRVWLGVVRAEAQDDGDREAKQGQSETLVPQLLGHRSSAVSQTSCHISEADTERPRQRAADAVLPEQGNNLN